MLEYIKRQCSFGGMKVGIVYLSNFFELFSCVFSSTHEISLLKEREKCIQQILAFIQKIQQEHKIIFIIQGRSISQYGMDQLALNSSTDNPILLHQNSTLASSALRNCNVNLVLVKLNERVNNNDRGGSSKF